MQSISLKDKNKALDLAVSILKKGGVIVYPTDTVYGLGCDATNSKAVSKVKDIKNRENKKPILIMASDKNMIENYAELTLLAKKLIKKFLPGPLALVLQTKKNSELKNIQNKDGSIGFRVPNNDFCLELVKRFGKPITSTSVNISGMNQCRNLSCMLGQLKEKTVKIDLVIDAGKLQRQEPSTIVDGSGENVKILRNGVIQEKLLLELF